MMENVINNELPDIKELLSIDYAKGIMRKSTGCNPVNRNFARHMKAVSLLRYSG